MSLLKSNTLLKCFFICCAYFFSLSSQASQLEHLITFDDVKDTEFNWQQVTPHPNKPNYFFIFNQKGHLYSIIKGKKTPQPLLKLNDVFNDDIFLSALTLHPNFALKDLPGYHTFYTAHQETFNSTAQIARLPKQPLKNSAFDLVITEWQFTADMKKVVEASQREVLRIASPEQQMMVKQLSFNPYLKPWQDDFGTLFITLNDHKNYKEHPLYSGAVLRINPDKFGLRNYTIPTTNPFIKNDDISNEVVLTGLKNVEKIIWQKKNNQQWFVLTKQENKILLTTATFGHDLRQTDLPVISTFKHQNLHNIVWYEGRDIPSLLYKIVYLSFTNQRWQLHSISINADNSILDNALINISNQNEQAQLGLTTTPNLELLLLNKSEGIISQIKSLDNKNTPQHLTSNNDSTSINQSQVILWLIILLIVAAVIIIIKKIKNYDKDRAIVKKQFANFKMSNQGNRIDIYRRHQTEPSVSLKLKEIISSKVILNDEVISVIDSSPENAYSQQQQLRVSNTFSLEYRHKMVDNRSRVISLELIDNENNVYLICLYARRGNQRYTRIGYQDCLTMIYDWSWKISNKINPEHTGKKSNR